MASTIKVKRSAVSGNAPNTSNIDTGELALNTADGILYSSSGSSVFEVGANLTSLAVSGQVTLTNNISANGSIGTAGQALLSDGSSKVYWGDVAASGSSGAAAGTRTSYYYTAGEGDTTFSGADDNSNVADLEVSFVDVFLNGILISPTNYTSNTTAIVFTSGVSNNDIVTIVASDVVAGDVAKTYVYSANGTQTVFSGTDLDSQTLSITTDYYDVYVNGILIYDNSNNYTSNSSAVTFTTTLNANDIVTIKTYELAPGRAVLTGIDDNSTATTITIDSSNRVGVNETTPAYNLDVGGSLGVTSLYISDTEVTSTATELNLLDGVTGTLVTEAGTQTLTNKTLTSPVISTITNTGTLTLPTSTGTVALTSDIPTNVSSLTNDSGYITASSTDTLTNKSGNISQWTNDSGYITASSTDTLTNKSGNISQWTNDSGYSTTTGTVTSVSGTGTVNGLTLSGTVTSSGNITLGGTFAATVSEITDLTATATELNTLDGITATTAELNLLDGVTATTAELNYTDGVTSNIQTQLDAKAPLASPAFTGTATGVNLTLSGDLTVNGTTTTLNTTNTVVADNLIELNNGVTSNANDSGIVIERGSTGDNAFMGWDESADGFVLGTTTATGSSTGNLTITAGPLSISSLSVTDAATTRTNLGVDAAGTDNSTDVTLAGSLDYLTLSGQQITLGSVDLTTDITGVLPIANGGTNASTAADARTNLDVDQAGTAVAMAIALG